jgi:hypothetical protein
MRCGKPYDRADVRVILVRFIPFRFAFHFYYLPNSGEGDGFMSLDFQRTLKGNPHYDPNAKVRHMLIPVHTFLSLPDARSGRVSGTTSSCSTSAWCNIMQTYWSRTRGSLCGGWWCPPEITISFPALKHLQARVAVEHTWSAVLFQRQASHFHKRHVPYWCVTALP